MAVLAVVVAGSALLVGARLLVDSDAAPSFDGGPFAATGVVVNPPDPRPGGLQRGDVVRALEGRSVDDLLRAGPFRDGPHSGAELSYRVLRDGQVRDVPVTLGRFPFRDVLARNGAMLLLFAVAAAIGLYVFARRPDEPAAAPLAIFGVALLAAMLNATFAWEVADIAFRRWLFWLSRVMARAVVCPRRRILGPLCPGLP